MAVFTMVLKDVIDVNAGNIGLNDYPIFDEEYRESLNTKIIDHFLNREIGQETISMFTHAMRRKMNEIMPLYNQLYKSQLLSLDPLITFRTESTSTSSGTNTATAVGESQATNSTASDGKSRVVGSETPQSMLSDTGEYATSAQDSVSGSSGTATAQDSNSSTQSGEQVGTGESIASGFTTPQTALLMQFRETFLNIDMQVIEELEGLFMLVWDNGDSRFGRSAYYPFGVF